MLTNSTLNWQSRLDTDGILWLSLDKAESTTNTLTVAVLDEFSVILNTLNESPAVRALVILSAKSASFILGADIEQFSLLESKEAAFQLIHQGQGLYDQLASLSIPTIALIDGLCLGGGLELALACDYRIAEASVKTRLGLPEVMLGLHPGWGGTVRLPKLIGAVNALDLILSGRSVTSLVAKRLGLVDALVPRRQLATAAHFYAMTAPALKKPTRLAHFSNQAWLRPLIAKVLHYRLTQKIRPEHYPAPFAVVNNWCKYGVSAEAYIAEAHSLASLYPNATVKNCLRVFGLQNELKRLGKATTTDSIDHVHVVGAGTMGGDIAAWCALSGYHVTLQDRSPEAIAPALKRANALFKKKLKERLLVQAAMDRLQPDLEGCGIAKADIIIEAVFEDLAVKQALFQSLELSAKPTALLATNTSSISLIAISQAMRQPERLVGIHFFNPVASMRLVEVVQSEQTARAAVATALNFVGKIDKLPLTVKASPGFLVNRVLMPYLMECMALLAEGYKAETIDAAAMHFGMPLGPVELADTVGLDVCLAVATNLTEHFGGMVPERLKNLVQERFLGRKSGQGFYQYKKNKAVKAKAVLTPAVYEKISTRLVYRLLNEAVACVREQVVIKADFVDAAMIFATGFAPFRGGPLQYAIQLGQSEVLACFQRLQTTCGERFKADAYWPVLFSCSNDS